MSSRALARQASGACEGPHGASSGPSHAPLAGAPSPADLRVRAGRVVCPATGRDGPGAVAVRGGRIVADDGPARETLDFPDAVLLPGLVDLHAHPARGASKYGICPDRYMLPTGV